jgi:hypothetical protein
MPIEDHAGDQDLLVTSEPKVALSTPATNRGWLVGHTYLSDDQVAAQNTKSQTISGPGIIP